MGFVNRHFDGPFLAFVLRIIFRTLQFVLAITVTGLYGIRINAERKAHVQTSPEWLYAEVVAGISALTCIIYMLPGVKSYLLWAWDALLFVLWLALFGVFGRLYIRRGVEAADQYQGTNTERMKHAVWVDLANMFLWLLTMIGGVVRFCAWRRERTLHTGRAYANI